MRKINSLFFRITIMLILFVSVSAYGQGLQGTDLSRVKATDISDAQLKSFIERGEKEGISSTEAMEMARARGMSASVANELMQRAQQLQQATSSGDDEQYATREVDNDSTSEQVKMVDPTPGPENGGTGCGVNHFRGRHIQRQSALRALHEHSHPRELHP